MVSFKAQRFTFLLLPWVFCLENPRMAEPGRLPSMGSHRVGHNWSDLAAAAAAARSSLLCGLSVVSVLGLLIWWLLSKRGTGSGRMVQWLQHVVLVVLVLRLPLLGLKGWVALRHVESSRTRGWTCDPCIGRWILIHCITREVQVLRFDRNERTSPSQCSSSADDILAHSVLRPQLRESSCLLDSPLLPASNLLASSVYSTSVYSTSRFSRIYLFFGH